MLSYLYSFVASDPKQAFLAEVASFDFKTRKQPRCKKVELTGARELPCQVNGDILSFKKQWTLNKASTRHATDFVIILTRETMLKKQLENFYRASLRRTIQSKFYCTSWYVIEYLEQCLKKKGFLRENPRLYNTLSSELKYDLINFNKASLRKIVPIERVAPWTLEDTVLRSIQRPRKLRKVYTVEYPLIWTPRDTLFKDLKQPRKLNQTNVTKLCPVDNPLFMEYSKNYWVQHPIKFTWVV